MAASSAAAASAGSSKSRRKTGMFFFVFGATDFAEVLSFILNWQGCTISGFDYDADAKVEVEVHGLGKGGKLDVIESFDEMGLRENLIRGIYAYGRLK